jgi:DNA-binding GntR family transcriptional regulator
LIPTDTQRAYDQIKERIITTQMPPSSVIQETALMEELGFGRTPIREALKLLEADKLVVVAPRRGMFVAGIDITDLAEIQEIRSVLDPLCVRLAASRILPGELAELKATVAEAAAVVEQGDPSRMLQLDRHFHRVIAGATRNEFLAAEIDQLYNLSLRIWHFYLGRLALDDLAFDALAEIVDAIEARDAARAESAMLRHISHFGDAVKRNL